MLGWVKIRTRLYNESRYKSHNPKVYQKSDHQQPFSWVVLVIIIHAFLLICCSQITSKNNEAQHKISRNQVIIKCKQWRYQLKHPFPPALWAIKFSDFIGTRSQLFLFYFKLFCTLRFYTHILYVCIFHQNIGLVVLAQHSQKLGMKTDRDCCI